jgi:pSer/pThr/pTyr-binding forkhead associated (FHA) protein
MENLETSQEADGLPGTAAPWRESAPLPVPADFFPLRLVLQPSGATVELTQPDMLIGRHSHADLRLALPEVSRRHCRFLFSQGAWQLIDLNSLNGVHVNGLPIQQTTVHPGDLIRIGGFTFLVELGETRTEAVENETSPGLLRGIFTKRSVSLSESPAAEGDGESVPRRRAS